MPDKPRKLLQLFVRRGALRRFDKLKTNTADLPVVVDWDRRQSLPADAPAVDRRGNPPDTWKMADFVVVDPSKDPPTE
jgi:hypothetical protein